MKGIVLAGGTGSRLYPITKVYSKQLTNIYDKPLIYYPLSILMLGGIREILIVSNKETIPMYQQLFGDGSHLGISIQYSLQQAPNGIAESFILGEKFIGKDNVTLILGDNIFYGQLDFFYRALKRTDGATIFGYRVNDPERYGVVEFDKSGKAISIEEKPKHPRSSYAVPGLYVYDNNVVEISKNIKPSPRGELEITDVNNTYMKSNNLNVEMIGRGVAWLDAGTHESLIQAATFIEAIQQRQGLMISCPEEIAYRMGYISREQVQVLGKKLAGNSYGEYLLELVL